MKKLICSLIIFYSFIAVAQTDSSLILQACNSYIDGFYSGDTVKLQQAISKDLYKIGYSRNKMTKQYEYKGQMTYNKALTYCRNVLKSGRIVSESAPRKIEILDISNSIASTKITAWWGIDYMLLVKEDNAWIIREVLWEGPLEK